MAAKRTMLKRARHAMPAFVTEALSSSGLMAAYRARPAYQQNDYLGWIVQAKLPTTTQKRVTQMLSELEGGTTYMMMRWRAPE